MKISNVKNLILILTTLGFSNTLLANLDKIKDTAAEVQVSDEKIVNLLNYLVKTGKVNYDSATGTFELNDSLFSKLNEKNLITADGNTSSSDTTADGGNIK